MTTRIHVRPVGDLRVPFPNGRVLPPQGALVKRTLFVEKRLKAGEIEIVNDPDTQEGKAAVAQLSATVDDAVQTVPVRRRKAKAAAAAETAVTAAEETVQESN